MHTSCNLKSMVLKIPNPLNSCESSMLHNHTSVGIIGDNTDIHWASLPYITPGNHGKKQDDMMKSGYHEQKEKTKRWYVYYNPTSTSNLIKIRLVKAILNKATQDLATSYRGHLRLTLSFANEITAVKILTGSSDMSFFSPKNLYVQSVVNKVFGNCMCPHKVLNLLFI